LRFFGDPYILGALVGGPVLSFHALEGQQDTPEAYICLVLSRRPIVPDSSKRILMDMTTLSTNMPTQTSIGLILSTPLP
jgi:hypothetical protein